MRSLFSVVAILCLPTSLTATDPPLVEKYLHTGELAKGEQALVVRLDKHPGDDQARFGLGVLQFARALERLGQALYEYGAKSENTNVPFLRFPVPKNEHPATISYRAFGRVLDVFAADLVRAERTLAAIKDDKVKLPLRLADARFDLTGSGQAGEKFVDVLTRFNGGRFDFLKDNPDFLVCFDRGDVAWFRAYCHLLCAAVEGYRAFDLEAEFDKRVGDVFPKVEPGRKKKPVDDEFELVLADAPRLGRFRTHLLAVCELNHETWKYIRAETDNDHEWLPNPKQTAVIGMRVTNEMIDGWLAMIDQLDGLLKGKRLIPSGLLGLVVGNTGQKGLNIRTLLDDPPAGLSDKKLRKDGIDAKYLEPEGTKKEFDINVVLRVSNMFTNPLSYMAWFN